MHEAKKQLDKVGLNIHNKYSLSNIILFPLNIANIQYKYSAQIYLQHGYSKLVDNMSTREKQMKEKVKEEKGR